MYHLTNNPVPHSKKNQKNALLELLYLLILQVEDKELKGFSYEPVTSNE